MKKMALFFLLLFTTVQVLPGIKGIFSDNMNTVVFNLDEEKQTEKSQVECQKDKKEYISYQRISVVLTQKLHTALHLADKLSPAPYLEMLTPPPNC